MVWLLKQELDIDRFKSVSEVDSQETRGFNYGFFLNFNWHDKKKEKILLRFKNSSSKRSSTKLLAILNLLSTV